MRGVLIKELGSNKADDQVVPVAQCPTEGGQKNGEQRPLPTDDECGLVI